MIGPPAAKEASGKRAAAAAVEGEAGAAPASIASFKRN
jgi:hypothetical protein